MSYISYVDLESLIKKTDGWANNTKNTLATEIGQHITCRCSISTI